MKAENKGLAIILVVFAVVVAVGGVYFLAIPPALPASLLIPAGTVMHFRPDYGNQFSVEFNVTRTTGRLVGELYADNGGSLMVISANASLVIFPRPAFCLTPWNFTADISLPAGQYLLWFYGPTWNNLTVKQTFQVVYPGGPAYSGVDPIRSGPWPDCRMG